MYVLYMRVCMHWCICTGVYAWLYIGALVYMYNYSIKINLVFLYQLDLNNALILQSDR